MDLGAGGVDFPADATLDATSRASMQTYTLGVMLAISSKSGNRTAVSSPRD